MGHTHTVVDSDTNHFVIDPITRQITNETKKLCLVKGDHNSEVFTFEVPLKVEEHDMSLCNRIEVHFINVEGKSTRNKSEKVYEVQDFAVDQDDPNKMTFSWLISGDATKYAGNLSFIVRFACIPDDDGVVAYSWNTTIYSGITVLDTISNSEMVLEEYKDILQEWYNKLIAVTDGAIDMNTKEPVKFWVGTHIEYTELTDIQEDCLYIITDEDKVKEVSDRVTELKSSLQEEVTARQTADTNLTNGINTLGTGLGNIATELRGADTVLGNSINEVKEYVEGVPERVETLEKLIKQHYITFSSDQPFTLSSSVTGSVAWPGNLEYRTDDSVWTVWDRASAITAVQGGEDHNNEYRIYLRGKGNKTICGNTNYGGKGNKFVLTGDGDIHCSGNIENLLDYEITRDGDHPPMGDYCFYHLFKDCTNLVSAPELPGIYLANSCYQGMFEGCTSLTQAPELPATKLFGYCYQEMFKGCTSLTKAPALPATSVSSGGYKYMFSGCTGLLLPPALPATSVTSDGYNGMFMGCSSMARLPKLHITGIGMDSCVDMFYGCSLIKISNTETDEEYRYAWRIPTEGTIPDMDWPSSGWSTDMFKFTGGTFTGSPNIHTTYYTNMLPV